MALGSWNRRNRRVQAPDVRTCSTLRAESFQYAAFVSIDWADQKHVWSLQEANSSTREHGEVGHMPEAIEAWIAQMSQRFAGRPIAVAVEQSRGALVFMNLSQVYQIDFKMCERRRFGQRYAFIGRHSDPKEPAS